MRRDVLGHEPPFAAGFREAAVGIYGAVLGYDAQRGERRAHERHRRERRGELRERQRDAVADALGPLRW